MKTSPSTHGDFTQGPMWRNITRIAVPMMVAQLVNILYNLVDRMFVGRIPAAGSLALTGLGLSIPVISLVMAFANLCGVGGAPLFSIARGEKNEEEARHIMGNTFVLLLIFSAALMVVGLTLCKPMLMLFGASAETLPYAYDYLFIYLWGTPFVMLTLGLNPFINAQDYSKYGMLTVTLGAVVNLALDPLFIFVFHWGVKGAAAATVISQAASCIWVLQFLTRGKADYKLERRYMKLKAKRIGNICALGVTGFIMSATNSIVGVTNNSVLQTWGGDLYVGVMTVIGSLREVFTMALNGFVNGVQPVLSYNLGAKAFGRIRKGINFAILAPLVYNTVVWLAIMLAPGFFIRIFNNEADLIVAGIPAIRIYFSCWLFMGLQMSTQPIFVALRRTKTSVFFSLLRKVILVVPLVLILPGAGFGVHGVFLAEPVSAVIGGVSSILVMYFSVLKPLRQMELEHG